MGARWVDSGTARPRSLLPVVVRAWASFVGLARVWQVVVIVGGVALLVCAIALI